MEILPAEEQCEEVSQILKTVAHPKRLLILCLLSGGAKTVGALETACGASQSSVSQFLTRMKSEGLLKSRREGGYTFYEIADKRIHTLIANVCKIFC
jgi:DNA-binding transcriptional ArsR family regulator